MSLNRRQFLSLSAGALAVLPRDAAAQTTRRLLHRGAGIHNMMNWGILQEGSATRYAPRPFETPRNAFPEALAREFAAAGFDFIRLSLDVGPFMQLQGSDRTALERKLLANIGRLHALGLDVLVDCHPVEQVPLYSPQSILEDLESPLFGEYRAMIVRLAAMLANVRTGRVVLELMNEPLMNNAAHRTQVMVWGAAQLSLHDAARRAAPDLPLMLTGAHYGGISGLNDLDPSPYADSNVLYSYHYYMPLSFTHQGVDYGTPDAATSPYVSDLPYPYDAIPVEEIEAALEARIAAAPLDAGAKAAAREHAQSILGRFLADGWNRQRIEDDFAIVAKWADRHAIARERIVMGEFGVTRRSGKLMGAAEIYRRRWMSDVTHVAASHGFGWSIWDLNSYQMGISRFDDETRLDRELVSVLAMPG
ncbi:glycoside hydrolase family 5 protein [Aquamicrobium ahrensii]|uniref:Glycoside hydrolase family 5 domain-containing protein n=1 Tax=Aquamicrobium ahrensii TaxID=469551 RepID=A0ABV2KRX8_9HYPH